MKFKRHEIIRDVLSIGAFCESEIREKIVRERKISVPIPVLNSHLVYKFVSGNFSFVYDCSVCSQPFKS